MIGSWIELLNFSICVGGLMIAVLGLLLAFSASYVDRVTKQFFTLVFSLLLAYLLFNLLGQISAISGTASLSKFALFSESFFSSLLWDDETGDYTEASTEEIAIATDAEGFTATLSPEDLEYLDYVEGMLLMDASDEEFSGYIDFGTMRNNLLDWNTGTVLSLYDGTWPVFGDQPVPLYDQTSNDHSRRSLIPVKLNGAYTYLVVVFPAGSTEGRIIGANAGYDENGLPIRSVTRLNPGDEIVPVYTFYYGDEEKGDLEEGEFDGTPVIWQEGLTVTYEDLSDEEEPVLMYFCFIFNDIFGEYTMSDVTAFEL